MEAVATLPAELLVGRSQSNILSPVCFKGQLGAVNLGSRRVSKGIPLAASSAVFLALSLKEGPVGPALVVERGFSTQRKPSVFVGQWNGLSLT